VLLVNMRVHQKCVEVEAEMRRQGSTGKPTQGSTVVVNVKPGVFNQGLFSARDRQVKIAARRLRVCGIGSLVLRSRSFDTPDAVLYSAGDTFDSKHRTTVKCRKRRILPNNGGFDPDDAPVNALNLIGSVSTDDENVNTGIEMMFVLEGLRFIECGSNGAAEPRAAVEVINVKCMRIRHCEFRNNGGRAHAGAAGLRMSVENWLDLSGKNLFDRLQSGLYTELYVSDSSFAYNTGERGSAVSVVGTEDWPAAAYMNLKRTKLVHNTAEEYGGALLMQNGMAVVKDCEFRNNVARFGGAINSVSSIVKLVNTVLVNNYANVHGGVLYATARRRKLMPTIVVDSCEMRNNRAEQFGGALYFAMGHTSIIMSQFDSEEKKKFAKSIFVSYAAVTLTNSTLSSNAADGGAAIACFGETHLTIYKSSLVSNEALHDGGALLSSARCRMEVLKKTRFAHNRAERGGSIFAGGVGLSRLRDSTLSGNTATADGGSIYVTDRAIAVLESVKLSDSKAPNGGAIYVGSGGNKAGVGAQVYMIDQTVLHNNTGTKGGALYTAKHSHVQLSLTTFDQNTASEGGAAYISGSLHFMNGVVFVSNSASYSKLCRGYEGYGGAVYVNLYKQVNVSVAAFQQLAFHTSINSDAYTVDKEHNEVHRLQLIRDAKKAADIAEAKQEAEFFLSTSVVFEANVAHSSGGGIFYNYAGFNDTLAAATAAAATAAAAAADKTIPVTGKANAVVVAATEAEDNTALLECSASRAAAQQADATCVFMRNKASYGEDSSLSKVHLTALGSERFQFTSGEVYSAAAAAAHKKTTTPPPPLAHSTWQAAAAATRRVGIMPGADMPFGTLVITVRDDFAQQLLGVHQSFAIRLDLLSNDGALMHASQVSLSGQLTREAVEGQSRFANLRLYTAPSLYKCFAATDKFPHHSATQSPTTPPPTTTKSKTKTKPTTPPPTKTKTETKPVKTSSARRLLQLSEASLMQRITDECGASYLESGAVTRRLEQDVLESEADFGTGNIATNGGINTWGGAPLILRVSSNPATTVLYVPLTILMCGTGHALLPVPLMNAGGGALLDVKQGGARKTLGECHMIEDITEFARVGYMVLISASILIIFAGIVFIFLFRKNPVMLASAPIFLIGTCVGYILALGCLILTIFHQQVWTCHLKAALFQVSISLSLVCLFVKNWRLSKIFNNTMLRDYSHINTWYLMRRAIAVVLVDVLLMSLWSVIFPFHIDNARVLYCERDNPVTSRLFLIVIFAFKGSLCMFGDRLTRKIANLPAHFNERLALSWNNGALFLIANAVSPLIIDNAPSSLMVFIYGTLAAILTSFFFLLVPKYRKIFLQVKELVEMQDLQAQTQRTSTMNDLAVKRASAQVLNSAKRTRKRTLLTSSSSSSSSSSSVGSPSRSSNAGSDDSGFSGSSGAPPSVTLQPRASRKGSVLERRTMSSIFGAGALSMARKRTNASVLTRKKVFVARSTNVKPNFLTSKSDVDAPWRDVTKGMEVTALQALVPNETNKLLSGVEKMTDDLSNLAAESERVNDEMAAMRRRLHKQECRALSELWELRYRGKGMSEWL
jgi:hypothetical protein